MQLVQPSPAASTDPERCDFCHKSRREVFWLVAGDGVAICNECVGLCVDIIDGTADRPPPPPAREALAAGLVGQDAAARTLATLVEQTAALPDGATAPIALLVGPPGTGKSHAVDLLVQSGTLPAVHSHASRLSAVGYVGEQVGNLLSDLVEQGAPLDGPGLVAMDGVEGLGHASRPTDPRQIDGEEVQLELVTLLDGAAVSDPLGTGAVVAVDRLLRLLVATLDPLPETDAGVRAALAEAGLLPGVIARIEVIVRFPRRDRAALARLTSDLPLSDGGRAALLDRAATADGGWTVQAARASWVAAGKPTPITPDTLAGWGLA